MAGGYRKQASIETIERQIIQTFSGQNPPDADGLEQVKAMLQAHGEELRAGRADSAAMRAMADRSAAAVAAHLVEVVCPMLLARLGASLPISDDRSTGRSAGEASAVDYAEAIACLFAWETAVGADTRLRSAIQTRLGTITRACRVRIERHLQVCSDEDFPDVRLLARDILRVEAVEWVVGIAGGPAQARDLRHLAHHAARKAVQWAGQVFDRFKAEPDEFSHFDAVATLSAVDDLLVVILRILESDQDDRRAGSHPFVLTLGEQALQDFANGLEHMTRRYLEIAETHLLAEGAAGAFVLSVLQLLQRILRLGHALLLTVDIMEIHLNHAATRRRTTALRATLQKALAKPGASKDYPARLAVLDAALASSGG